VDSIPKVTSISFSSDDGGLSDPRLAKILGRLTELSVNHSYNPRDLFRWPDSLSLQSPWMSEELLSVHGSHYAKSLTSQQTIYLSHWELINFFSFSVHGICDLISRILEVVPRRGTTPISDYLHHFIDEENKHLWFFTNFCNRYGRKIYPTCKFPMHYTEADTVEEFVIFSRILITESIGDFFNVRMARDTHLPKIVRDINAMHHRDETRHIAMGSIVVDRLLKSARKNWSDEVSQQVAHSLGKYMQYSVECLYNVRAYGDANLPNNYAIRRALLNDPARIDFHLQVLDRSIRFFESRGLPVMKSFCWRRNAQS